MKVIKIYKLLLPVLSVLLPTATAYAADSSLPPVVRPETRQYVSADDGVSNDELFKGYVEQRLSESIPGHAPAAGRSATRSGTGGLTGTALALYNALVPVIREIAAGTRTSTVVEIPVEDVYEQVYPGLCGPFTADQVGFSGNFWNGGSWASGTHEKAVELWGIAACINELVDALITDFPYEMYWYDKTRGVSYYPYPNYSGTTVDGQQAISCSGDLSFSFTVAKEYSLSNTTGTTNTSGSLSLVTTAIANARAIVSAHAGETPLQRLASYRDEICGRVEYNHAAAGDNPPPYGNPWQMLWVFDGNASTNIVCEGYSKAFKYLCDLSGFTDIECLLVTGDMFSSSSDAPATGEGPHMWNVVRMDDGRNYLVDVTNSDEGSVGESGGLFMAYGLLGEYATGYRVPFTSGSGTIYINYVYDNDTKRTLGEQALTISPAAYAAPATKVSLSEDAAVAAQLAAYRGQTGVHVNFRRTNITADGGRYCTVCLPFAFTPPACVGTFYTLAGVTLEDDQWVADFTAVSGGTLAANTPYVLEPAFASVDFSGDYTIPATIEAGTTTVGQWSLKGTYASRTWTAADAGRDYGFTDSNGRSTDGTYVTGGSFVKCAAGASIVPMRCYLTYSGRAGSRTPDGGLPERITVRFRDTRGDTTGIGVLDLATGVIHADTWYDLRGRRLPGRPSRGGIYIHNGRKETVR